jgi:ATP-dependent Clp protease ATP-binding subunit ClpC
MGVEEMSDSDTDDRYTEQARWAMTLAQEAARKFKRGKIGTEHALIGLVLEKWDLAARALNKFDITEERVCEVVEVNDNAGHEVTSGQIPYTPLLKEAMDQSFREALGRGDQRIGTVHILLGLLWVRNSNSTRILHELNVEPEKIREEIFRELDHGCSEEESATKQAPPLRVSEEDQRVTIEMAPGHLLTQQVRVGEDGSLLITFKARPR